MTLVPASSHGGGGSSTSVQDADPGGAAGAGWLNTTDPGHGIPSNVRPFLVRNAAGTGWDEVQPIHRDAGGTVLGFLTFSDGGFVLQRIGGGEIFSLGADMTFLAGAGGNLGFRADVNTGSISMLAGSSGGTNPGIVLNTYWSVDGQGYEDFLASTAPLDAFVLTDHRKQWYDSTTGAARLRFKQKDAAGTVTSGYAESASPITSGALPTQAFVSGTGAQILTTRAVETITPVTFNPGAATTATCAVALSPDNVTYSTLGIETEPVGVAFDGTIHLIKVRVPAGWYLRLTVVNATLGTTSYY